MMTDGVTIDLVAKVAAIGPRLSGIEDSIIKLNDEMSDLKAIAKESKANQKGIATATRVLWVLIGILIGAGGSDVGFQLIKSLGQ